MAGSRLEKIGTIYTRTQGLIRSGALLWEDRPLWYDIYEAFPPKEEPCFSRPTPNIKVKSIFYHEDKIRAQFHRNNKHIGAVNLLRNQKSLTQRFISAYDKLEKQYAAAGNPVTEEQLYKEAIDLLKRDKETVKENDSVAEEEVQLTTAFKHPEPKLTTQSEAQLKVNVRDIFKE